MISHKLLTVINVSILLKDNLIKAQHSRSIQGMICLKSHPFKQYKLVNDSRVLDTKWLLSNENRTWIVQKMLMRRVLSNRYRITQEKLQYHGIFTQWYWNFSCENRTHFQTKIANVEQVYWWCLILFFSWKYEHPGVLLGVIVDEVDWIEIWNLI